MLCQRLLQLFWELLGILALSRCLQFEAEQSIVIERCLEQEAMVDNQDLWSP